MLIWIALLALVFSVGAFVLGRRQLAREGLKVAGFTAVVAVAVELIVSGVLGS